LDDALGRFAATARAQAAPRANAVCQRLIGTLRREVLDRILILNEAHLRTVLNEFASHYNGARPHQGIAQRVPDGDPDHLVAKVIDLDSARIRRRSVLGGLTSGVSNSCLEASTDRRSAAGIVLPSGTGWTAPPAAAEVGGLARPGPFRQNRVSDPMFIACGTPFTGYPDRTGPDPVDLAECRRAAWYRIALERTVACV
jgi:hypothetical protein